ncbi:MAG: hypothetical protein AB7P00_38290 [Sandaracinaceae bacterium]
MTSLARRASLVLVALIACAGCDRNRSIRLEINGTTAPLHAYVLDTVPELCASSDPRQVLVDGRVPGSVVMRFEIDAPSSFASDSFMTSEGALLVVGTDGCNVERVGCVALDLPAEDPVRVDVITYESSTPFCDPEVGCTCGAEDCATLGDNSPCVGDAAPGVCCGGACVAGECCTVGQACGVDGSVCCVEHRCVTFADCPCSAPLPDGSICLDLNGASGMCEMETCSPAGCGGCARPLICDPTCTLDALIDPDELTVPIAVVFYQMDQRFGVESIGASTLTIPGMNTKLPLEVPPDYVQLCRHEPEVCSAAPECSCADPNEPRLAFAKLAFAGGASSEGTGRLLVIWASRDVAATDFGDGSEFTRLGLASHFRGPFPAGFSLWAPDVTGTFEQVSPMSAPMDSVAACASGGTRCDPLGPF